MSPTYRVGVTGHRWNRLQEANVALLRQQLSTVLEGVRRTLRGPASVPAPQLLSALAEGSDRLVASAALDLGYALRCVLPFSRESYLDDFATPASKDEFRNLLARAAEVIEPRTRPATQAQRNAGYAGAGRRIVVTSHLLLAIWDGLPARGEGGTGQIVGEALERARPVVWIHAAAPHGARLSAGSGDWQELPAAAGAARLSQFVTQSTAFPLELDTGKKGNTNG